MDLRKALADLLKRGPQTISPTAHYTGYVWANRDIGPKELATLEGKLFFNSLQPIMTAQRLLGGVTVEGFLLARHRLIDLRLTEAIESGRIGQVVEIAAGMSPRGRVFAERYGDRITYVEADLPSMAERKREALAKLGPLGDHHRVVDIDALDDDGPNSLATVVANLDPERGIAFITEGLLNYLSADDVRGLWARIARAGTSFPSAVYLSDLHLASENSGTLIRIYSLALGTFVRGKMHFHFQDVADAERALDDAGFAEAAVLLPSDFADEVPGADSPTARGVRVVEATLGS